MIFISTLDEFIRQEKFTNPLKDEELRDELLLEFDNFNAPAVKEDNHALAKLILNLLLMEPGTYPDTPEMGINIAQYQFDFLNITTVTKIQQHIQDQIDRYIPTYNIQKVLVVPNTNKNTQKKELIIGFSVGHILDDGTSEYDNFFIRIANDEIKGIKTQIIY